MRSKLLITIVFIQTVFIVFLIFIIFSKSINILGISVNNIDSKTIQSVPQEGAKYFWEPQANTVIEERKDYISYVPRYSINSDSLNERFNYSILKSPGVFRIITIGDSFTFGENVNTSENWTELLEDKLNKTIFCTKLQKVEVINLGVGGYDINYETIRYKLRGKKYNPDLLLWYLVSPMRITELIMETKLKNEEKYREEGINMESYMPWVLANKEVQSMFSIQTHYNYQLKMLRKIDSLYSGPIIFMVREYGSSDNPFPYLEKYVNVRSNSIIHQTVHVERIKKYHFNGNDLHPNRDGHFAIAEDMFRYITQNKFIPCTK